MFANTRWLSESRYPVRGALLPVAARSYTVLTLSMTHCYRLHESTLDSHASASLDLRVIVNAYLSRTIVVYILALTDGLVVYRRCIGRY